MARLKVVFMGTPDFAVPALKALSERHDIVCVYSQPPRPAGRGYKLQLSPVQTFATRKRLQVRHPVSLKSIEEQELFSSLNADIAVVSAYGLILPQAILDATKMGCINIHASLLPRWRGAAPIQRAIMAGDKETGLTIMQMVKALDAGDMLIKKALPIVSGMTAGHLHDILSRVAAGLILKALDGIEKNSLKPKQQQENKVTYAKKIVKSEGRINWNNSAVEIERTVRGFSPHPGTWFEHNGKRIKILECEVIKDIDKNYESGTVIKDMVIACGKDALKILTLQKAGKTPTDAKDFLRGYNLPPNSRLL
ncbi:MAG: methionyl-tRNA formyltransferase [Alphaproteobacteria bacterium]|nr:methionyl-tRNA formyltransferase [Alphaproteobacteria bacterium]